MISSKQYKPNQSFGLLLLGGPGTGKSQLAMEFPAPYFIDADNNLGGASRLFKQRYPDKEWWYDQCDYDENDKEVPYDQRWLRMDKLIRAAVVKPEIQTIVLDGLTKVNDYLMDYVISQKPAKDERKMTIGDWGPFKIFLHRLIPLCRGCRKYFIMTAHERYDKDEMTGMVRHAVNLSGSVADEIGGMFSDVWRCETKEDTVMASDGKSAKMALVYQIRTTPNERMQLKNSLQMPTVVKEPTWKILEPYLMKGV